MASLDRSLRKELERTVKLARRVAEAGALKAVAQLGVGDAEGPKHLSVDERALRNRLRAHGRQLGDQRDIKNGMQETARLVQECAYEHWHRMLFARFLAETDLLIEPDSGVAITLDEVQELAREKATDWLPLASEYAERMLPQIFRKEDPVLDISLPPETRSEMEDLLKGLPKTVFEADDSLGWVYQFWQADKKEAVNKSEVKIGADELPAVTQLFTEDYMVLFLLHNTLGAWWAGKVLAGNPKLAASATNEDELRAACKVGDVEWTYLRFVRETGEDGAMGPWRPAAGAFDGWPKVAKELTVLDPCMGSGHFLVFALPILMAFRISEEELGERDGIDAVLRDNLFGLEIDPRCTQIAAFNLAFAAWRRTGFHPLPQLNLACSGLAIGVTKAEWLKLAEKAVAAADPAAKRDLLGAEDNLLTHGLEERVKNGLEALYDLFAKAPWLGSLIDPRRIGGDILSEGFDRLEPLLTSIMTAADTDEAREMAVTARGMTKAAELLKARFTLVVTNVPYLGRGKQSDWLKTECERIDVNTRGDIAYSFFSVFSDLKRSITTSLVLPHNWLFLGSYEKARLDLINSQNIQIVARLGHSAFESVSGQVVSVYLSICSSCTSQWEALSGLSHIISAESGDSNQKSSNLVSAKVQECIQSRFMDTPKARIYIDSTDNSVPRLSDRASLFQGTSSGDSAKYERKFWEIQKLDENWRPFLEPSRKGLLDGRQSILRYEGDHGELANDPGARIRGREAWGKSGLCIAVSSDLFVSRLAGEIYNKALTSIIFHDSGDEKAFLCFARSGELLSELRKIDQKLMLAPGALMDVPFDVERWKEAASRTQLDDSDHTRDITQWLFDGATLGAEQVLQAATLRLAGYEWPRQTGSDFLDWPSISADDLKVHSDDDGIVCLTAVKGELPAEQRLNSLLADAFGGDWSASKLASLLAECSFASKSLDDWLRDGFFEQHCALFQQRPFVWHIWDGRRDGFHALVNYHRLVAPNGEGRRTLEKLIYSYLGDWIDRQREDQKAGMEGADARLAHAEHLRSELIKILDGEPPYDIFVRWKPLHEQPVGWDPDINDGVRMNIRPFMTARPIGAKAKGACILRSTPKIKWDKDRGKEPNRGKDDYPWFWGWDETSTDFAGRDKFDGNRWNDMHYSRAVKQGARDRHRTKSRGGS